MMKTKKFLGDSPNLDNQSELRVKNKKCFLRYFSSLIREYSGTRKTCLQHDLSVLWIYHWKWKYINQLQLVHLCCSREYCYPHNNRRVQKIFIYRKYIRRNIKFHWIFTSCNQKSYASISRSMQLRSKHSRLRSGWSCPSPNSIFRRKPRRSNSQPIQVF